MADITIKESAVGFRKRVVFIISEIERHFNGSLIGKQVLDVGCGTGTLISIPLAQRGLSVNAIDIHPESIDYAKKIAGDKYPNLVFDCKYLESCADHSYDVVIASEVL